LAAAAAAAVLSAAYFLWLRDSGLVRVDHVAISGLSGRDAPTIRRALVSAGETMTTLHLDPGRLRRAVAGYPAVAAVRAEADFPHGLRVHVVERRPVAFALAGRERVPVAADGTLLPGVAAQSRLPVLRLARSGRGDARLKAAGAAPPALLARLRDVSPVPGRGLVAHLRGGPDVVLGTPARLRAKWIAAARVLADPGSAGASYLDVSLPERPVAGGVPPSRSP
jgi:cell division protein FtsQ